MVFLIDDIILAPLKLFTQIVDKIRERAEQEMYDPEMIRAALKEEELLYEAGEITEEEYEKRKSSLMRRLERAEQLKKERSKERSEE